MLRIPIARLPMGFGPNLTVTKLSASQPATLTTLSAGFTATLHPVLGQPRSRILRCPRMVVLCAVLLVDCEEWFYIFLGSLPSARRAIVCILVSLEQSQVVD